MNILPSYLRFSGVNCGWFQNLMMLNNKMKIIYVEQLISTPKFCQIINRNLSTKLTVLICEKIKAINATKIDHTVIIS